MSRTDPSRPDLPRYFRQAERYPRLERDLERSLALRWKRSRDQRAAEQLLLSHLRYVVMIAAKYRRYPVHFGDLVAEGNLGMLIALERFDPEQNTRFITYASFWIRAKIVGYVLANWSVAKSGNGPLRSKLFFALRRERARTLSEFGAGAEADAELERRLGLNIGKIRGMLAHLDQHDLSLDQPLGPDREDTLLDSLATEGEGHETVFARQQSQHTAEELVEEALKVLDPREAFIATHRLMASGDEELSLAEIGRRLGVTRERARQLETRAKTKLKTFIERRSRKIGHDPRALIAA